MMNPIGSATTDPTSFATPGIGAVPTDLASNEVLGKDEFLKLLVAQLQNQDPLSPMDGQEMAVQLAQFSSVEQLIEINRNFETQAVSQAGMTGLMSSTLGASLIGQQVLARGDVLHLPQDTQVQFDLSADADVTLRVFDSAGKEVASQPLGPMSAGRQSVDAQTVTQGLAAGDYTFQIDAVDDQSVVVEADELTTFVVDGISFGQNGMTISGGGISVVLGDIVEIRQATTSGTTP